MLFCDDICLMEEVHEQAKIANVDGDSNSSYSKIVSTVGRLEASHFDEEKVAAEEDADEELHDLNGGYELGDDIRCAYLHRACVSIFLRIYLEVES